MKIIISLIITLCIFYSFSVNAGEIKIIIPNIEDEKGVIHFGLYNKAEYFPEKEGRILGGHEDVLAVKKNGLIITNLKESEYAVAIYHDENSNNKFDKFLAIPKERYGFSNNAKVFLGPPKFKDASFFLGSNEKIEITIDLR